MHRGRVADTEENSWKILLYETHVGHTRRLFFNTLLGGVGEMMRVVALFAGSPAERRLRRGRSPGARAAPRHTSYPRPSQSDVSEPATVAKYWAKEQFRAKVEKYEDKLLSHLWRRFLLFSFVPRTFLYSVEMVEEYFTILILCVCEVIIEDFRVDSISLSPNKTPLPC